MTTNLQTIFISTANKDKIIVVTRPTCKTYHRYLIFTVHWTLKPPAQKIKHVFCEQKRYEFFPLFIYF